MCRSVNLPAPYGALLALGLGPVLGLSLQASTVAAADTSRRSSAINAQSAFVPRPSDAKAATIGIVRDRREGIFTSVDASCTRRGTRKFKCTFLAAGGGAADRGKGTVRFNAAATRVKYDFSVRRSLSTCETDCVSYLRWRGTA